MSVGKKIGLFILAIILAVTLTVNVWYVWIYFFGPEKVISKTFKVGALTTADGTTHNIFEVEYFANEDNSGYEAFEIKFTNFMDESKDAVFIQGLQYVANTQTSSIGIELGHNDVWVANSPYKTTGIAGGKKKYYYCYNTYVPTATTEVFNYMSSDDEIYMKSTNPLTMDSGYKIQIGKDLYLMRFKGAPVNDLQQEPKLSTKVGTVRTYHNVWKADIYHTQYEAYDVNYFVKRLYESVKTLPAGTIDDKIFEWGNLFNYYKYDETEKGYSKNPTDYTDVKLVSGDIKSYYSIMVKTHANGLSKSSDSLFGSILGNGSLDLNNESVSESYFVGRTVVDCDLSSFDLVVVQDNNVALKLNQSFIDYYSQYKDAIVLDIVIDLDDLSNAGYTFVGFSDNHGLDNFTIYKCYTISNGEVVDDFTNELIEVAV